MVVVIEIVNYLGAITNCEEKPNTLPAEMVPRYVCYALEAVLVFRCQIYHLRLCSRKGAPFAVVGFSIPYHHQAGVGNFGNKVSHRRIYFEDGGYHPPQFELL